MFSSEGFTTALIIFGVACGVIGWGVIELMLWLFSFIHVTIG